jgi:hypothetical protein
MLAVFDRQASAIGKDNAHQQKVERLRSYGPKWPRKHSPGLNGTKLMAVLDGMDLSQSLQTILYVFSPFIRPEAAKKA